MARRCLVVSYYFPPTGGGGVQRVTKLIKYLSRSGWEFTVISASSDFVNLPIDNLIITEIPSSATVIRLPIRGDRKKTGILSSFSFLKRSSLINRWLSAFFFIPDMRKQWSETIFNPIIQLMQKSEFDCILISAPPYSLALLAEKLTRVTGIPVVLDMRDPWTINPYKLHPTSWHLKQDRLMEIKAIAGVKFGVSAYQSLIDFYSDSIPSFKNENWICIPNGYDEEDFQDLKAERTDNEMFNIAFSGTFYSHLNNPRPLFKAISNLTNTEKNKIRFHHIGQSQIDLINLARTYGLTENIKQWGYLDHKQALQVLSGMDGMCFILDDKNRESGYTIGGKVYEYLRIKKPILALVPEKGEAANLIHKTKSGLVISPNNSAKITATLSEWLQQQPRFEFSDIEIYSREEQAKMFAGFFENILKINN